MKYCPVCDTQYTDDLATCPKDGAPLMAMKEHVDPMIGLVLKERYRLLSKIGEGGMGAVYLAEQQPLGRKVAVKLLLSVAQSDPALIKRFYREAQALSAISHPNIVSIIDFGTTEEGTIFLVMEFLEGHQLDYYSGDHKLSPQEFDNIISQACAGLSAAHKIGLVHRDIKPANIFICENNGQKLVKILDFGIVKEDQGSNSTNLTQKGTVIGTPGYISPEQIKGDSTPDPRSDVYAMGAVLYFMMQGNRPYDGPSTQSIIFRQLTEPPTPVDFAAKGYPKAMRNIVLKAMAMEPKDRYQTVEELAQDVHAAITGKNRINWKKVIIANAAGAVTTLLLALLLQGGIAYHFSHVKNNEAIIFGMSNPMSGHDREMGRSVMRGQQVAIAAFNKSGGFHGRPVELILKNDYYKPDKAVENTRSFIDAGALAIVGNGGTENVKAVLPLIEESKTPLIGPICGADFLQPHKPLPYVFALRAGYSAQIEKIYHHFTTKLSLKENEIAFFAQRDGYGEEVVNSAKNYLAAIGSHHQPLVIWHEVGSYNLQEELDFIHQHPQIKAIITASIAHPIAELLSALRNEGQTIAFATTGSISNVALYQELASYGMTNFGEIYVSQTIPPLDADLPILRRFWEDFIRFAPEEQTNEMMLEGYLNMQLALRALANLPEDFTKEDYKASLEAITNSDLGMGDTCKMSPTDHQCLDKIWLLRFDDKNYDKGNWHVLP